MRTRNKLHVNRLPAFRAFCIENGWHPMPEKGPYEVLRMRRDGWREPIIIYKRDSTDNGGELVHYTTYGSGSAMLKQFLKVRGK